MAGASMLPSPPATRRTFPDVSAALLNGGWARSYDGGRRGSWC